MIERSRKVGCAFKGFASLVAAYLVGSVLVVLNGCVYVTASSGPDTESDRSLRYSWLPQFEYDRNANLWRLEFNAGSDYCRTGVYPPDTWVTGLKHWDVFGGLIECLVRLPTFPLEWVFSKKYSKSYAVEILDSNSKTGGVVRVEIPKCGRDDPPVLLHPMFRSYWGCAELEVDFPACERIFGNKLTLSDEEYMDALERRRKYGHADPVSRLERVDPVLMWKDAGGNEFLLVFKNVYDRQKDRRLIEEGTLLGGDGGNGIVGQQLLYFKNSRCVRAFVFSTAPYMVYARNFQFDTYDGRYVNIGDLGRSNAIHPALNEWIYRQIDLETGEDRKVGHYGAEPIGGGEKGFEIRVTERKTAER